MDESKLSPPVRRINEQVFLYHNAECTKIKVPEIGAAQAIWYDLAAIRTFYREIRNKHVSQPIVYILACRIGPFMWWISRCIHKAGGTILINPDGHEWMRGKWSKPVRAYWKWSEKLMVKYADRVVCDSKHIEAYIRKEYHNYRPMTSYIAYGSDIA